MIKRSAWFPKTDAMRLSYGCKHNNSYSLESNFPFVTIATA